MLKIARPMRFARSNRKNCGVRAYVSIQEHVIASYSHLRSWQAGSFARGSKGYHWRPWFVR